MILYGTGSVAPRHSGPAGVHAACSCRRKAGTTLLGVGLSSDTISATQRAGTHTANRTSPRAQRKKASLTAHSRSRHPRARRDWHSRHRAARLPLPCPRRCWVLRGRSWSFSGGFEACLGMKKSVLDGGGGASGVHEAKESAGWSWRASKKSQSHTRAR